MAASKQERTLIRDIKGDGRQDQGGKDSTTKSDEVTSKSSKMDNIDQKVEDSTPI